MSRPVHTPIVTDAKSYLVALIAAAEIHFDARPATHSHSIYSSAPGGMATATWRTAHRRLTIRSSLPGRFSWEASENGLPLGCADRGAVDARGKRDWYRDVDELRRLLAELVRAK